MMDMDANSLYGYCMSQYLPAVGFHLYNTQEIESFDLQSFPDESFLGLLLEVDLYIDPPLHDHMKCLPNCVEHLNVIYVTLLRNKEQKDKLETISQFQEPFNFY